MRFKVEMSKKPKKKIKIMDRKKKCLMEPRILYKIAKNAKDLPTEEAFEQIIEAVDKEYPGYINNVPKEKRVWIFNHAGGAKGQMTLLHGSLREYLILFGTTQGTEGHSGRYRAEVFDFLFKGEMLCEYEGKFENEVHRPGKIAYLPSSIVKHYCIKKDGWMLEYARGNITSMLPFGLSDTIFSTLDYDITWRTVREYGKLVIRNLFKKGKDIDIILKWLFMALALVLLAVLL